MQLRLVSDLPQTAFDRFWAVYPRKVAKGYARERFAQALRVTTEDKLIAGAAAYAKWCRENNVEKRFIAHPATWLNPKHERWEDEYETDDIAAALDEVFK